MQTEPTNMSTEPARTLGDIFANKAMIKTFILAFAGIVAALFKVSVDDAFIDNIVTLIMYGSMIGTALMAQWENRQRAKEQAEATRSAVFAPATTEALVKQAAATGVPEVPPPPAQV